MPTAGEWGALQSMAEVLSRSGLVPSALRRKPDDIMLILLTGRDLRLQPTVALNKIHVIEGKPTLAAEMMAGLVNRQPGMSIWPDPDNDGTKAVAHAVRDGRELKFGFTMHDARTAGLAGKGNWAKWPQFMLWARAVSGLCRMAFSDVLAGVSYTPEELGAAVDPESGEVLDVVHRVLAEAPDALFMSNVNVAAARQKAVDAGLSDDEIAEMVERATDGRTDQLGEVLKSEVKALRDAMQYLLLRKQPAAEQEEVFEGGDTDDGPPNPPRPVQAETLSGMPPLEFPSLSDAGDRIRAAIPARGPSSQPPCTTAQRTAVNAALSGAGVTGERRKPVLSSLLGRTIKSSSDLTFAEASALINEFKEQT